MTVPNDFPVADAIAAHALMRPWWRALADGDDVSVRRLNHPASVGDGGPGVAARLRHALGVSSEQCAAMGVYNTLSILVDGGWAFFCKTGVRTTYDRPIPTRPPTPVGDTGRGWLMRVERVDDGSWRVWGWADQAEAIDRVILPSVTVAAAEGRR
jgi:hypothetical protein